MRPSSHRIADERDIPGKLAVRARGVRYGCASSCLPGENDIGRRCTSAPGARDTAPAIVPGSPAVRDAATAMRGQVPAEARLARRHALYRASAAAQAWATMPAHPR